QLYRYGFQNQEGDDEVAGKGNSVNYTFRMHNPRLGRFFAVDPLSSMYPHNSPYAFSENRVIDAIELEGLELFLVHGTWGKSKSFRPTLKMVVSDIFSNQSNHTFSWSGYNTDKARQKAAVRLVEQIKRTKPLNGEPITILGHSHGGNIAIIAAQILAQDEDYSDREINVVTMNTPVREYQISAENELRINHYHIYNPNEKKVVPEGGSGNYFLGIKSGKKFLGLLPTGERGEAKHKFDNPDANIEYNDQYQGFVGFIKTGSLSASFGHQGWRSKNMGDWAPKLREARNKKMSKNKSGGGNNGTGRELSSPPTNAPRGHGGSGMGQMHLSEMEQVEQSE
ncbi:MAG: Mbeg1-like protein, partial [Kangiellaceae bacterium]|nr:Mbeg1-like protein [Kangiellaceae bacterium]